MPPPPPPPQGDGSMTAKFKNSHRGDRWWWWGWAISMKSFPIISRHPWAVNNLTMSENMAYCGTNSNSAPPPPLSAIIFW